MLLDRTLMTACSVGTPIRKPQSTSSTVCLESIPTMPFQCARSFTSSGQDCRPSCIPAVGTVCVLPCCAGAVGLPLLPPPTSRLQADSMSVSNTSTTGPVKSRCVCFGTYLFICCLHCFCHLQKYQEHRLVVNLSKVKASRSGQQSNRWRVRCLHLIFFMVKCTCISRALARKPTSLCTTVDFLNGCPK